MSDVSTSTRVGLNAALLILSRVVGLAMAMVQSGLIFRALSLESQGQFGAALGFASFFTVFATLGIQRLLVREIARDTTHAWDQVWTSLVVTGTLSSLCVGLIWLARQGDALQSAAFWAGVSVVFVWALQQPFESLLIARERMGLIAVMNIGVGAAKVMLVYLLLGQPGSAAHAHAILALANGLGLLLCAAAAIRVGGWQRPHLRPSAAMAQARECIPFTVAMLCSWIYFKSDIVLLEWLRGEADAGIYAPPQRLMEPLLMVASLWGTAVFPALCRLTHTDSGQFQQLKATSVRLAVLVACPMALGLAVLARPVMLLLTGDDPALEQYAFVLRLLCFVVPSFYFNSLAQEMLYAVHRNWFVVASLGVAAVVSVAGNLILIPRFGVAGLAGVAVAANLAVSLMFGIGLRRELTDGRLGVLALRTLLASAVMGVAAWYAAPWSMGLAIVVGVVVYGVMHGMLGTLNALERDMVRHVLRRGR
jgi:O-antigen/teichoic acid export membrane protein